MRTERNKWNPNSLDYYLEPTDFDYLKDEFVAVEDCLGISLTSIKKPNLSIHIGQFDIKYDNDVSHLKMMIATQRVEIKESLLYSNHLSFEYQQVIPKTAEKLYELISEFRFDSFGTTKKEKIIEFLVGNQF